MSNKKKAAIDICNELHRENKISHPDYLTVMDAICEFDTLNERDEELEALWEQLADVPVDPDTEKLEAPYLHFPAGTDREDVWHYFDERHSKGVAYLLYGDGVDRTDRTAMLNYYNTLCFDCESKDCAFNCCGECRYPLVEHRVPVMTDDDGCLEYCIGISEK